jgi:hypothetical protein
MRNAGTNEYNMRGVGSPFERNSILTLMRQPHYRAMMRKCLDEVSNVDHHLRRVDGKNRLYAASTLFVRRCNAEGLWQSKERVTITIGRVRDSLREDKSLYLDAASE